MKRILCILLCLILSLSLPGCKMEKEHESVFYYRRAELQFGSHDSVIQSEPRDIAGHEGDISYLIALYLAGPLDEDLISPFHESTRLLSVSRSGEELTIRLTDSGAYILDSEFSLGCACLAMTCMENPEISRITVEIHDRSVTMTRSNMVLSEQTTLTASAMEDVQ